MKSMFTIFMVSCVAVCCTSFVCGQQQESVSGQQQENDLSTLPGYYAVRNILTDAFGNQLISEDETYLAQTSEELQTYYDLKLDYQYIASEAIRKQLDLSDEEGLIIESVAEDGDGYEIGFRAADLVLQIDEKPVNTQYEFVIALNESRDRPAKALIRRDGNTQELEFQLEPLGTQSSDRWMIGVSVAEISDLLQTHLGTDGTVITSIREDSPAEQMGLQVDDVIYQVNGEAIASADDLRAAVQSAKDNALTLELIRAGQRRVVELSPVPRPLKVESSRPTNFLNLQLRAIQRSVIPIETRYVPLDGSLLPVEVRFVTDSDDDHADENSELELTLKKLDELSVQIDELRSLIESKNPDRE